MWRHLLHYPVNKSLFMPKSNLLLDWMIRIIYGKRISDDGWGCTCWSHPVNPGCQRIETSLETSTGSGSSRMMKENFMIWDSRVAKER